MSFLEKAENFDPKKRILKEITDALKKQEEFRGRFPFDANPKAIDSLTAESLFNPPHGPENEYFFYWIEFPLKTLGKMTVRSTAVYRNACQHIDIFKIILHKLMDPSLSLAEKIDLDEINQIQHLGGERLVIKKILAAYDDNLIPVFRTDHLLYFYRVLVGDHMLPRGFDGFSMGRQYHHLMDGLVSKKNQNPTTAEWSSPYFMKFLYDSFPMKQEPAEQPPISIEKLKEYGLYEELQYEQEVLFLFSKLHEKLGFPIILKVQTEFPDVSAIDNHRNPVRIELEWKASNFIEHNHPPSGCEYVICWENDLQDPWQDHWPSIISLREYLANESE